MIWSISDYITFNFDNIIESGTVMNKCKVKYVSELIKEKQW